MRFFNKISRKTTEATNKIAREAKLKMKISDNKCKIKDLYEAIGKISYESHIREKGTNLYEKIKDSCSKIDKLYRSLSWLNRRQASTFFLSFVGNSKILSNSDSIL